MALKYFNYKGKKVSDKKLSDMEKVLTEMIENIKKEIDILSKKHFDLHHKTYPGVNSKTDKFVEENLPELESLSSNLKRLYYDVESMIKTRGIIRRYHYFPGTKK